MIAAYIGDEANLKRVYGGKAAARLEKEVRLLPGVFTKDDSEGLKEAEALFSTWGMPSFSEAEIRERFPKLKYLFYAAGTVQAFAAPFLACGVRVFSAWQANAVPVAEFTFAQILLALKGYFTVQRKTRTSRKDALRLFGAYPGGYGVKVGLLGCGAVGSRVAERLKTTDLEVLAFDPFLSDARAAELGVWKMEMDEIFSSCDVISNHLANLPETVGIIKRRHFLSMKPYSIFINTGRGPQLDEKDLYDALTADPTRTALLDVMTEEWDSDLNPLNALENCFITPHIAGSSGQEVMRMADYMADALECVLSGKPCGYEVTPEMLKTMA